MKKLFERAPVGRKAYDAPRVRALELRTAIVALSGGTPDFDENDDGWDDDTPGTVWSRKKNFWDTPDWSY
ncbi:MAG: hypothetical protein J6M53_04160 [Bacteroidaceae bacterium]|nr:hypothetical protein [Bacteroidaceae bacterium]